MLWWVVLTATVGTPREESWPGIQNNEDLQSYRFDNYAPQSLVHRAPRLDGDGLDLLNKFLCYEAKKRISAVDAMRHPYFRTLGSMLHKLPDSTYPPPATNRLFALLGFDSFDSLDSLDFLESIP